MEMRQVVCLGLLVAFLACAAWADIINGSFETGDFTGWRTQISLAAVEVAAGGTDGAWHARGELFGVQAGDIFGPGLIVVWQEVCVPADAQYLLFDAQVAGPAYLNVHVHDAGEHNPDLTVTASGWNRYSVAVWDLQGLVRPVIFMARDYDVGQRFIALDAVHFTNVPEPSTAAMLVSCVGLAWVLQVVEPLARKGARR